MKTIHFDVDAELKKHLKGDMRPESLQSIDSSEDVSKVDAISIKTGSNADKSTLNPFINLKLLVTQTIGNIFTLQKVKLIRPLLNFNPYIHG